MDLLTAYQLGEYPPLIGVHFNVLRLIERLHDEGGELGRRVKDQEQRLAGRRKETVGLVLFVESLLDRARLEQPGRPQTYPEYQRWATQVSIEVFAATQTSVHETAAFFLGQNLGDLMLTLALRAIVEDWASVSPEHGFLIAQAGSLAASEVKAQTNLERVALSPALPAATTELMKDVPAIFFELQRADVDRSRVFDKLEAKRQVLAHSLMPSAAKA